MNRISNLRFARFATKQIVEKVPVSSSEDSIHDPVDSEVHC